MMRLKGDFLDAGVNMSLDNDNHVECVTLLQRENTRNFVTVQNPLCKDDIRVAI